MALSHPIVRNEIYADLTQLFKKPLILGASVSADYFTESPGKRLALRYTSKEQIKVTALRGKAAKEILKPVTESGLKGRSVVIGLDLFFWDSFLPGVHDSLAALERLVTQTERQGIALILGEVPELMSQRQTQLNLINKKMQDLARRHSHLRILPLNSILRKTQRDGFILHDGRKYELEELLPDGLHISEIASEYLANQIEATL